VHRVVHFAADSGVAVAANVRSLVFEPTRGTVTPTATLRVEGARAAVHQVVNIMGRIRSCTPDAAAMPGYKAC
jgi:type IV fimbrial biogenesis protein FimT